MMSVQSKLGSGITRTVAVATPEASPLTVLNIWARLTYSPSPTPELTMNSSLISSFAPAARGGMLHVRVRLVLTGSMAELLERADPSTYLNPGGKVSTICRLSSGPTVVFVTVIVYGTNWPRLTFVTDAVLVIETL